MVVSRIFIIFFLLMMLPTLAQAKVSAHVDRTTIEEGETFSLMLQSEGEDPDLTTLEPFFDVLRTSHSSKVSIINGTINRVHEWIVNLAPKNIGEQVIPEIKFGNEATAPILVNVIKPIATSAGQGADIYLEAKVDQPSVYVQSQLTYSMRLYRAVEIAEGSLTEPTFDNAVVERLGTDVTFQAQRNERLYHVTERRYAIFPQQSGTLELPAMVFQGLVVDPQSQQSSNDPFNRFFQTQRTKHVRIKSAALVVDVLPQAAEFNGKHWLPAKRLVLSSSWSPEHPSFKEGEPATRTIRIEAWGLTGSQLPELKMLEVDGVKQYVDQPTVETLQRSDNLLAVREEKFAIIPTSGGKLVLPEIRLSWWNTEFEREEIASIPPETIDVIAATKPTVQTPVVAQTDNETSPEVQAPATIVTKNDPGFWPYLTAMAVLAWLVTLVVLVLVSRKTSRSPVANNNTLANFPTPSMTQALAVLKKACVNNDSAAASQALLDWGQAVWPEQPPRNLQQIANQLHNSSVKQIFADFAQLLYKDGSRHWDGAKFWQDISSCLKQPKPPIQKRLKSLPDLYPQNG